MYAEMEMKNPFETKFSQVRYLKKKLPLLKLQLLKNTRVHTCITHSYLR